MLPGLVHRPIHSNGEQAAVQLAELAWSQKVRLVDSETVPRIAVECNEVSLVMDVRK